MKLFRKILFWCHLVAGVAAGIVILIMSVTGVLLTYERQIILWADTRAYQIRPLAPGAPRLGVEALLAKARESQSGAPVTLTIRTGEAMPAAMGFAGGRTVYFDPYTGAALGEGAKGVRDFFHVVTDWHRWLGAHGASRATARAVTGACNLAFLFIVAGGLYLWWPRQWSWVQVRNVVWFRRGLPGKARDFNWHNVIGLWSWAPLFIVVLSATVISYPWASNLVYRVVGETPPAPGRGPGPANSNDGSRRAAAGSSIEGFDRLWARAESQVSGWRSISLRLPTAVDAPVVFTIDEGDSGQPQKRAQLTLDRSSGEVVKWEPFSSYTRGRQLRSILRFAHTGEVAGFVGQTIAGVVSLGGAVLVWTGLALAWRRWRAWMAQRSKETRKARKEDAEITEGGALTR